MRSRALLPRALRTIRQHRLISSGDRVVVAVSGGSDSVALSWALHDLAPQTGGEVAGLVHVHHGLRGEAADADQAFCRELAARMRVPFDTVRVDTRAEAVRAHVSIEAAARRLRYDALAQAAARLGANVIATGHTLDDQAETVMLRALRGAGSRGLSGVRVKRGAIVRPLLDCRRSEAVAFLDARAESYRTDASNADRSISRNRLRHDVMPVLAEFTPRAAEALARCASLAADDENYLTDAAILAAADSVLVSETGVQLLCGALAALPAAIARRVARLALERAAPDGRWSSRDLDAVRLLADGRGGVHLDLHRVSLERRGDHVSVMPGGQPIVAPFDVPLAVPGFAVVAAAGLELQAEYADRLSEPVGAARGHRVVCRADAVATPLRVRNRRIGDRMKPLGASGRRKLQDVFVDRKIPRDARDRAAVVEDASGRIIWVVGVALAEAARVTAPETKVIILTARPV